MTRADFTVELLRMAKGFGKTKEFSEERADALFAAYGHLSIDVWREGVTLALQEPFYPARRKLEFIIGDAERRIHAQTKTRQERDSRAALARLAEARPEPQAHADAIVAQVWSRAAIMLLTGTAKLEVLSFLEIMDRDYVGYGFADRFRVDQQLGEPAGAF